MMSEMTYLNLIRINVTDFDILGSEQCAGIETTTHNNVEHNHTGPDTVSKEDANWTGRRSSADNIETTDPGPVTGTRIPSLASKPRG